MNEVMGLIRVGFDKPKFYKRSVWNSAIKVMDFLVVKTGGEISQCNKGPGMEKYTTRVVIDERSLYRWAYLYKSSNEKLTYRDMRPEIDRIAKDMGLPVTSRKVLTAYFQQFSIN